jgi:hypothetical protein
MLSKKIRQTAFLFYGRGVSILVASYQWTRKQYKDCEECENEIPPEDNRLLVYTREGDQYHFCSKNCFLMHTHEEKRNILHFLQFEDLTAAPVFSEGGGNRFVREVVDGIPPMQPEGAFYFSVNWDTA